MLGLGYGSRGYVAQDHSIDSEDTFRRSSGRTEAREGRSARLREPDRALID